jgi:ribonucleoside-diphosphate reductase alpha chain
MGQHHQAVRRRLPPDRSGSTHKFEIHAKNQTTGELETVDGYITVNQYDDGCPGEIFIRMAKMGSQVSGFIDAWAISVSMLLQTGTSIDIICDKFRGAKFEPSGRTDNDAIRFAQSPIDYIARWLEIKFVDGELAADDDEPAFGRARVCERPDCEETEDVSLRQGRWVCKHHGSGKK